MWSEVYPVVPQPSPLPHGPSARSEFYLACYLVSPVLVGVPVVAQDVECVDARPDPPFGAMHFAYCRPTSAPYAGYGVRLTALARKSYSF